MFKQIFAPLFRRPFDLFEDMIGVAAIFIILFMGLSLPGLG